MSDSTSISDTTGSESPPVFIAGATGYLGRALIDVLLARGRSVHAVARAESAKKIPSAVRVVTGDVLDDSTFAHAIPPGATFVHLVGTPHPNPSKAAEFVRVDLGSVKAAVLAATRAGVRHFVYVSVAHPAPVMKAYIEARSQAEMLVQVSGIPATILRPWYVLGPGHWWPYALVPVYAVLRQIPRTRDTASRLGLVTRAQMIAALAGAIDVVPAKGLRVIEVPEIQRAR